MTAPRSVPRAAVEPGLAVAFGLLFGGLGASAWLLTHGRRPVSTCIRTASWRVKGVVVLLGAHLILSLPHDPLTAVGRLIENAARRLS